VIVVGLSGGEIEDRKMAIEGHACSGNNNHHQQENAARDKELTEIRARMDELSLWVQQDTKSRWVYEWPMKTKIKCLVRELVPRRQQRLLKGWLRHAENLNRSEEEMVQVCEPEAGGNLSDAEDDMRSAEDLKECQESREEIPNFQEGNKMRSLRDLIDCQEDSEGILHFQEGNEMRSLRDLIDYQEDNQGISYFQEGNEMGSKDLIDCQGGSEKFPDCQVGRGTEVRLYKSLMKSKLSSDQKMQLMEKEDQDYSLIIGGIRIFLPNRLWEAKVCVANEAKTTNRQLVLTVKEEEALENMLEATQVEEEDAHFEEWLTIFSQEAERTASLKFVEVEEEEANNMIFVDLYE
jgi:hypothetical protein